MTQTPLRIPSGFAPERAALIREMEADGWTGRISSKGHAIMRAPDGTTTCSVAPKLGSPTRAAANQAATYRRWKRAQETVAEVLEIREDDLAWYRTQHTADLVRIAELTAEVEDWKRLAQEAINLL
jgi:hypothetical protein